MSLPKAVVASARLLGGRARWRARASATFRSLGTRIEHAALQSRSLRVLSAARRAPSERVEGLRGLDAACPSPQCEEIEFWQTTGRRSTWTDKLDRPAARSASGLARREQEGAALRSRTHDPSRVVDGDRSNQLQTYGYIDDCVQVLRPHIAKPEGSVRREGARPRPALDALDHDRTPHLAIGADRVRHLHWQRARDAAVPEIGADFVGGAEPTDRDSRVVHRRQASAQRRRDRDGSSIAEHDRLANGRVFRGKPATDQQTGRTHGTYLIVTVPEERHVGAPLVREQRRARAAHCAYRAVNHAAAAIPAGSPGSGQPWAGRSTWKRPPARSTRGSKPLPLIMAAPAMSPCTFIAFATDMSFGPILGTRDVVKSTAVGRRLLSVLPGKKEAEPHSARPGPTRDRSQR